MKQPCDNCGKKTSKIWLTRVGRDKYEHWCQKCVKEGGGNGKLMLEAYETFPMFENADLTDRGDKWYPMHRDSRADDWSGKP